MEPGPGPKLCGLCGNDCAGRPRIKDPKGRYCHKACYEQALRQRAGHTGGAETPDPAPFDPFEDIGDQGTTPCPSCAAPLAPGAVLCIACGYSREAGGKLVTTAAAPAPGAPGSAPACPLCGQTKKMRKPKLLYGVPVCKKCCYAFANRRQVAFLVDALIWWLVSFACGIGLGMVAIAMNLDEGTSNLLLVVAGWIVLPVVFSMKDGFGGYSPGKALLRVQVVDRRTLKPAGPLASLKRNLILIVPLMPLIIAFWLQRGYRLGDGWARTKVIWKKYATHPPFTGRVACDRCHYNVTRTTTDRCPECGAALPG